MITVQIANRQQRIKAPSALIRKVVRLAGKDVWDGAAISVSLLDHEEMVELNRRFTGREGDTDVLAFPLEDESASEERVVGEIVVCASRAEREARARNVEPVEELLLYVVHGAAHLLGYDDHSAAEKRRMYAREEEILQRAGVRYVRACARKRSRPGLSREKKSS